MYHKLIGCKKNQKNFVYKNKYHSNCLSLACCYKQGFFSKFRSECWPVPLRKHNNFPPKMNIFLVTILINSLNIG